jgi:hypothetical protein
MAIYFTLGSDVSIKKNALLVKNAGTEAGE